MAHFVKNDINFHGARSKTSVAENRSSKRQDYQSKNTNSMAKKESNDDGWGSIPNNSSDASCWGDIPNDSSVSDDAWGQDRLVTGKAERNRKFRNTKENNAFRVPFHSPLNWDDVDEDFPALGSVKPQVANVWEKRKEKFEEKKAIEPTTQTEEERMIQEAIELSMRESRLEEERRMQLEEEYRLQTKILEANPDMFEEFRLESEAAAANGFSSQPYDNFNDSSDFPKDEIVHNLKDCESVWGNVSEETIKKKDKKGRKKTESFQEEDNFPQLEDKSANAATGTKTKISKVVKMFGGWGTITKPTNNDNVETKPTNKSSKWETVDVNFANKPSNRNTNGVKPANNISNRDTVEVKPENKLSNWDAVTVETDREVSDWDTVDTKDYKAGSASEKVSLQKTNSEVHGKKSSWEEDSIKCTPTDKGWGSESFVEDKYSGASDNVELSLQNNSRTYSSGQKEQEFVSQSERKISKSKKDLETHPKEKPSFSRKDRKQTAACFKQENSHELDGNDGLILSNNKNEYQTNTSKQSQGISPRMSIEHSETKTEVGSLENKYPDSQKCAESDYAFLLNNIDNNYTSSTAQLKDSNEKHKIQKEKSCLSSALETDLYSRNNQLETSQLSNQTASTFGFDNLLSDYSISEHPSIPEPRPANNEAVHSSSNPQLGMLSNSNTASSLFDAESDSSIPIYRHDTKYKGALSLPPFSGFPTKAEDPELSMNNDGVSHIEPPKAPVSNPEIMNPAFLTQLRPLMTPFMNPALMMGMNPMNPMLMQQMLMLSNPFFAQQLQQMDMYYKSMGMPMTTGIPLFSQPIPPFANNPNLQASSNLMASVPSPTAENETTRQSIPKPSSSRPPGIDASHLLVEVPSEVDQPEEDNFWFQDYMSSDSSSFIPPPKPTPTVSALPNRVEVPPKLEMSNAAFAASSPNAQNMGKEGLPVMPDQSSFGNSNKCPDNLTSYATGWGDLEGDAQSNKDAAWREDVDGWENNNIASAKSMRNSSRYVPKTAAYRQPASQPYLGRPKT